MVSGVTDTYARITQNEFLDDAVPIIAVWFVEMTKTFKNNNLYLK